MPLKTSHLPCPGSTVSHQTPPELSGGSVTAAATLSFTSTVATVSTLFLVFSTQQLPSYCTVPSRALLLAAWLVPGEGASTAGKRSGTTPGWEVVKNGCEFAREASPPTLGQAAGMEVRPDSGTPLPAVREQNRSPFTPREHFLPQGSSSFCWNESGGRELLGPTVPTDKRLGDPFAGD